MDKSLNADSFDFHSFGLGLLIFMDIIAHYFNFLIYLIHIPGCGSSELFDENEGTTHVKQESLEVSIVSSFG